MIWHPIIGDGECLVWLQKVETRKYLDIVDPLLLWDTHCTQKFEVT